MKNMEKVRRINGIVIQEDIMSDIDQDFLKLFKEIKIAERQRETFEQGDYLQGFSAGLSSGIKLALNYICGIDTEVKDGELIVTQKFKMKYPR